MDRWGVTLIFPFHAGVGTYPIDFPTPAVDLRSGTLYGSGYWRLDSRGGNGLWGDTPPGWPRGPRLPWSSETAGVWGFLACWHDGASAALFQDPFWSPKVS